MLRALAAALLAAVAIAETQQNYYVTRVATPLLEQHGNSSAECEEYPQPICDDSDPSTLDRISWHSKELKDAVAVNGETVAMYECATYSVSAAPAAVAEITNSLFASHASKLCGYRIYASDADFSNPRQYLTVKASKGVIGSNCSDSDYPAERCPNATLGKSEKLHGSGYHG